MIRQAHTYLVGAVGGATLIAIAIAIFVLLVSAQVFRDWPLAALGGDDEGAAVSEAQPASGGSAGATAVGAGAGDAAAGGGRAQTGDGGRTNAQDAAGFVASNPGNGVGSTDPSGSETGARTPQGGDPATPGTPQSPNTAAPGSGASQSAGGGGGGGGGGGKTSGGGGLPESPVSTSSPSSQVTGTVNNTVNQVDESVLGGTLDKSGVTEVTEGGVNEVAGPESTVGKVVDEAVGAVGGLLGGKR